MISTSSMNISLVITEFLHVFKDLLAIGILSITWLSLFFVCVCVLNNFQKLFTLDSNFFSDRFLCMYIELSDYYLCICTCIINILSLICYFTLCIWYFGKIFHFLFSSEIFSFSYHWLLFASTSYLKDYQCFYNNEIIKVNDIQFLSFPYFTVNHPAPSLLIQ